jgi:glycosyltransferase involved in cell wall biosynthesis
MSPSGGDRPELSVLIPTHQRAELLPRVLRAWRDRLSGGPAAEIVVVDDGSTDDTPRVLAQVADTFSGGDVPLRHARHANAGAAVTRNRAIDMARGRVLLFSDDDMVPDDPALPRRHLAAQERLPGAWVSRLVVPDEVAETPFQHYWRRKLHAGTAQLADGTEMGRSGFWFATLSLPRALLGDRRFSPAFDGYGWQDLELGYRLWRDGVRARFLREATILHIDRVTFEAAQSKYHRLGQRAWTFARLHPSLDVRIWTGTHPLSRLARRALLHPLRAARLRGRDVAELSDRQIAVLLEVAYARGLADGEPSPRGGVDTDGGDA